jgi:ATP-dependent DNA ligase
MIETMKFEWVEDPQMVEALLCDSQVVAEQKMDGTRGMAELRYGKEPSMVSGNGNPLKHTAATQHLPGIWEALRSVMELMSPGDLVLLDGEVMIHTGQFHVFDVPYAQWRGARVAEPTDPFRTRRRVGEQLLHGPVFVDHSVVSMVPQAKGELGKRDLLDRCKEQGVEGVMFKHLESTYLPGERTRSVLKVKFVKTCDVVVLERNSGGAKNAVLGVRVASSGDVVCVGACSMIGKPDAQPGDVIEVAYLYWTGTSLYQPRMVRIREDKQPEECTLDQFRPYSREVVK